MTTDIKCCSNEVCKQYAGDPDCIVTKLAAKHTCRACLKDIDEGGVALVVTGTRDQNSLFFHMSIECLSTARSKNRGNEMCLHYIRDTIRESFDAQARVNLFLSGRI